MKIYNCQQGSDEWHKLRLGRPTASNFRHIITAAKGMYSKGTISYIAQLIQETRIPWMPERAETYTNRAMKWGSDMEAQARRWYTLETGNEVEQVGFVTTDDDRFGCSPDGLVYQEGKLVGGVEIKCTDPDSNRHTKWFLQKRLPNDHKAQVHGCMRICGAQWWDFVSYPPPANDDGENKGKRLPALRIRVTPDEFTEKLGEYMEFFWQEYQTALEEIKVAE